MQHWAADHEALLNAKLAGVKATLKLTPEQEKLWAPFESAVRDAAKLRADQMKAMMDRRQKMGDMMGQKGDSKDVTDMSQTDRAISSVDRLDAMAQRMSERAAALTNVANAAKPLYTSLDDSQKRLFGLLGGETLMMGHGHRAMGGRMGMTGGPGMMGEGGMGMMGREPGGTNMMGNSADNEEDGSDEE
jgi:hypothetical protein